MRVLICGVLLALTFATSVLAIGPVELARVSTEKLTYDLHLTVVQAEHVSRVIEEAIGELCELVADTSTDHRQMRNVIGALEMDLRGRIAEVLSEEQHDSLYQRRGMILPEPRLIDLNQSLALTIDQYSGLAELLESHKGPMPPPSRGGAGDAPQSRDERKDVMDKQDAEIAALLNERQKSIFAEMKKRRDPNHDRKPPRPRKH